MTVLYVLIPLAILTASAAVFAFLWATRTGQLDDLETPALRVLNDDDDGAERSAKAHERAGGP